MTTPAQLLKKAQKEKARVSTGRRGAVSIYTPYGEVAKTLRKKGFSWRQIVDWLNENSDIEANLPALVGYCHRAYPELKS